MRISILTIGTRGDLYPFIALGKALKQAGYDIKLVAHQEYQSFIEDHGLKFAKVIGSVSTSLQEDGVTKTMEKGSEEGLSLFFSLKKEADPLIEQAIKDFEVACRDADVILVSALTLFIGHYLSLHFNKPLIFASVNPAGPTKEFQHLLAKPRIKKGFFSASYNKMTHAFYGEVIWSLARTPLKKAWSKVLPPQPIPVREPLAKSFEKKPPLILYPYSPSVLPKPVDWGEIQHVVGYWFLDDKQFKAPKSLTDFIKAGDKPVYVGFGSMNNPKNSFLSTIILPIIKELGLRAIVQGDGSDVNDFKKDPNFLFVKYADFKWLFPKMKVLIHHGGVGTLGLGLQSGTPNLIVSSLPDQRFWGHRIYELGLAPMNISRSKINKTIFKKRLKEILHKKDFSKKAMEMAKNIQKEDGLKEAVKLIELFLSEKKLSLPNKEKAK